MLIKCPECKNVFDHREVAGLKDWASPAMQWGLGLFIAFGGIALGIGIGYLIWGM